MTLQEKIREVERTAYTDKIKDLVNLKGQKEGWSGEAMQTIQKLVTEDLVTKFKKGMEATSPEKGATETILESIGSVLQAADVIVCQLETPMETVGHALKRGRELGTTVILNPAPASGPLPEDWYAAIDYRYRQEIYDG